MTENESAENAVKSVLKQMKHLLEEINDCKKKSEIYMEIDIWQQKIDKWDGPNLNSTSSELIHYSEGKVEISNMLILYNNYLTNIVVQRDIDTTVQL